MSDTKLNYVRLFITSCNLTPVARVKENGDTGVCLFAQALKSVVKWASAF